MKIRQLPTIALIASAISISAPTFGAEVTWRATSAYPSNSNSGLAFKAMSEKLSELTNGEFVLKPHPDGSLGFKDGDNFHVVSDGLVEVAETSAGGLTGIDPLFGVVTLPFIAPDDDVIHHMMKVSKPTFGKIFEENGQMLVGWGTFPGVGVFAKDKTTTPAGMKGLKIRTYDAFSAEAFKSFGASPVQLAWGEVVPSLSSGVVDAVLTSTVGGVSTKLWDLGITDYSQIGYSTPITLLHINKEAFDDLDPEFKTAFLKAAEHFTTKNWELAQSTQRENLEELKTKGIEIHSNIDPDLKNKFQSAARSAADDWVEKTGTDGKALLNAVQER